MVNKFRYIFSNKDSNEIEKITYISLKEIEQGRLIYDLKNILFFQEVYLQDKEIKKIKKFIKMMFLIGLHIQEV